MRLAPRNRAAEVEVRRDRFMLKRGRVKGVREGRVASAVASGKYLRDIPCMQSMKNHA